MAPEKEIHMTSLLLQNACRTEQGRRTAKSPTTGGHAGRHRQQNVDLSPSTSLALHKFFLHAPSKTEAFGRRLALPTRHLEIARQMDLHVWITGALLTTESMLSEDKKMIGSMFIIEAETIDKVDEEDIYYKESVWDTERIVIVPLLYHQTCRYEIPSQLLPASPSLRRP
ncbi:hypothetical protein FB45DRAFT_1025013 [Roridomyces roridus]|uniref:YCII-related domain-containing protein n=1 Tax=Roridomyces roridus TaxID=1738132 RepID=A0AAD7C1Y9_9AGAR|nr:hypothetical protein FB45DRAFT_1025013 [Roridomyces roridus]